MKLKNIFIDALGFSGVATVSYGLHQIYQPAAWIFAGGAMLALAVLTARG